LFLINGLVIYFHESVYCEGQAPAAFTFLLTFKVQPPCDYKREFGYVALSNILGRKAGYPF
jgi:hypothetical protein